MSKSNNVSTLDHHTLADSELDAMSGGMLNLDIFGLGGIPACVYPASAADGEPFRSCDVPRWGRAV
jgi:hypothetical protein